MPNSPEQCHHCWERSPLPCPRDICSITHHINQGLYGFSSLLFPFLSATRSRTSVLTEQSSCPRKFLQRQATPWSPDLPFWIKTRVSPCTLVPTNPQMETELSCLGASLTLPGCQQLCAVRQRFSQGKDLSNQLERPL